MRETKKNKAHALLKRLRTGPDFRRDTMTKAEVMLWLGSWVTPLVIDLVPQLKEVSPDLIYPQNPRFIKNVTSS